MHVHDHDSCLAPFRCRSRLIPALLMLCAVALWGSHAAAQSGGFGSSSASSNDPSARAPRTVEYCPALMLNYEAIRADPMANMAFSTIVAQIGSDAATLAETRRVMIFFDLASGFEYAAMGAEDDSLGVAVVEASSAATVWNFMLLIEPMWGTAPQTSSSNDHYGRVLTLQTGDTESVFATPTGRETLLVGGSKAYFDAGTPFSETWMGRVWDWDEANSSRHFLSARWKLPEGAWKDHAQLHQADAFLRGALPPGTFGGSTTTLRQIVDGIESIEVAAIDLGPDNGNDRFSFTLTMKNAAIADELEGIMRRAANAFLNSGQADPSLTAIMNLSHLQRNGNSLVATSDLPSAMFWQGFIGGYLGSRNARGAAPGSGF